MEEKELKEARGKLSVLKTAFEAGEIKIKRVKSYRQKLAKLGHSFFRIRYQNTEAVVYDGAYEMPDKLSGFLKLRKQLNNFILAQLAKEI